MSIELVNKAISDNLEAVKKVPTELLLSTAHASARVLAGGGTIFICGNGGSASQAQHFSAELVGRFLMERPALPAVALTTDTSILTAVANDYSFADIFARQVNALLKPGDMLWGLSTSGRSPNVINALKAAKAAGGQTLLMGGAKMPEALECDIFLPAPSSETPRIQELHLLYGHILCHLIEHLLFDAPGELAL